MLEESDIGRLAPFIDWGDVHSATHRHADDLSESY